MLYQKLLVENNSYLLYISNACDFELHRHPEIEISYCLKGSYSITVNNEIYRLNEGDLVIINAMVAHEFHQDELSVGRSLTIELGPSFLREHFSVIANLNFDIKVFHLKADGRDNKSRETLLRLLEDTVELHQNRTDFSELTLKGNLYHISGVILQELLKGHSADSAKKTVQDITKIEKSLTFIYDKYAQPLDLDYVSKLCGYSKGHFCKVFKKIVGDTFHNVLNRHRVDIACLHLKDSHTSIENIAAQVGFADAKNFCRVFKKITGISPSTYRRNALSNSRQ